MARGAGLIGVEEIRTEVVRTPQSNSGLVGVRAGGVSIHSKVSSDVEPLLMLPVVVNFARDGVRKRWANARGLPSKTVRS